MSDWIALLIAGGLFAYFFTFIRSQDKAKQDREVADLTKIINQNEAKANEKQQEADKLYDEYIKELDNLDPKFRDHRDDSESH